MTLHNLGLAHLECGRNVEAIRHLKKSLDEARLVGLPDVEMMALVRLGMACFELKRFEQVSNYSDELAEVAGEEGHIENQLCAFHGKGIAQLLLGNSTEGRKSMRCALRLARKETELDWTVRCLTDIERKVSGKALSGLSLTEITKLARSEAKKRNPQIASMLWVQAANLIKIEGGLLVDELACLQQAWQLLERLNDVHDDMLYSLKQIHHGFWRSHQFDLALVVHRKIENLVDGILKIDYLNSRGYLLMEIDRFQEAEDVFTDLESQLREHESPERLSMVLNNLGECLRHQGKMIEAEARLQESETLAWEVGKVGEAIGTAHNRALLYQQKGDLESAAKLFEECRDKAKRRKIWNEHIRAWEALAHVANLQEREGLAKSRYEKALAEAKKHKLSHSLARITLNFSNLLYYEGESRKGLKLLQKHQRSFEEESGSYQYFFAMGLCLEDLNRLDEAVDNFQIAKERAMQFGDLANVANCLSHIAEIYIYRKDSTALIVDEIEQLISSSSDPEFTLAVTEVLLRIAIESDDDDWSQKVYDRGVKTCDQSLPHQIAHLNLIVAEHYWKSGGFEKRLEAMRVFAQTLMEAWNHDLGDVESDEDIDFSEDSMVTSLIGRVTSLLSLPPDNASPEEFEKLMADFEQKLQNELCKTSKDRRALKILLKPFEMAARLIPFADQPRKRLVEIENLMRELK